MAPPGATDRRAGRWRRPRIQKTLLHPLVVLVLRRSAMTVTLLFVVTALSFVLVSLTPGDPATQLLGINATPEVAARLQRELGLDLPIYQQYLDWVKGAVSGDFGVSAFSGEPVTHAINDRLPVTLTLLCGALLVSVVVGVGIGVFSAVRGGLPGRLVDGMALIGFAVPSFWLGALLISWFAVKLGWLPATGYVKFSDSPADWLRSLVLPVLELSLGCIAAIAKQTRDAMLDALGSEYVRMAWANGVPARSIFFRHALKNAGMPVLTVTGLQAVGLLGGAILVENVFALPGLGSLVVSATTQHDLPLIQGMVVYFTIIVVVINLLVDVAYSRLNPRLRTG